MERAAERKELLKVLSHVSSDYEDDMGFDKGALTRIGHEVFKTYDRIFIHIKDVSVQVRGEEAQVRLTAVVLATRRGEEENLFTERGSDHFLVTLRYMDNAWKIVRTQIPPVSFD